MKKQKAVMKAITAVVGAILLASSAFAANPTTYLVGEMQSSKKYEGRLIKETIDAAKNIEGHLTGKMDKKGEMLIKDQGQVAEFTKKIDATLDMALDVDIIRDKSIGLCEMWNSISSGTKQYLLSGENEELIAQIALCD